MSKLPNDASDVGDSVLTAVLRQLFRDFDRAGNQTYSWGDIQCWPDQSCSVLEQLGLLGEVERAKALEVFDCINRTFSEPIWLPNPDGTMVGAVGCGDSDCAAVHYIQPDEMRQWRMSLDGTAECLARSLQIQQGQETLIPDRLIFLGHAWDHRVLLARGLRWNDALATFGQHELLKSSDPSLVFAPDAQPRDDLQHIGRKFFSLREFASIKNGEFCLESSTIESWVHPRGHINSSPHASDEAQREIGSIETGRKFLRPFEGGELVFLPDRVELCGVRVLSNSKSPLMRTILELLCTRSETGGYRALTGDILAQLVGVNGGQGSIAGCVRDFRNRVIDQLRESLNLSLQKDDLIETLMAGYRLNPHIIVSGHDTQVGSRTVPAGSASCAGNLSRARDVLRLIRSGESCRLLELVQSLNCTPSQVRTAINTLKSEGKVKFAGAGRGGKYIATKLKRA